MSDHYFKNGNSTGIITLPNFYKYKGFIFEFHYFCVPIKLKKNYDPAKLQGRKFYKVITEWDKLSDKEKKKTKIYG